METKYLAIYRTVQEHLDDTHSHEQRTRQAARPLPWLLPQNSPKAKAKHLLPPHGSPDF